MTILINNEQEAFAVDEAFLERTVNAVLTMHGGVTDAQLGITLVDDPAIHELNLRFRGVDRPTDVLSFPMIEYGGDYEEGDDPWEDDDSLFLDKDPLTGEVLLGDLVISMPTCARQAQQYGHSPERELAYLTVHGMLHLLGYDHETDGDKVLMRSLEEKVLSSLNLPRAAVVTEGAILDLKSACLEAAAPSGAAVLASDGNLYLAAAQTGADALTAAMVKLPEAAHALACAVTGWVQNTAQPACPLHIYDGEGWYTHEES